ncbi:hypothetical protein AJ79_07937 [Helicocarpus griseus UAMH5409]|uniref:Aminoglycoside phosphotransferase domain-containing protein n=1 Tax=Helicocarpus griseus UAMH5409 TaxID=1447875 RepID=A0A2B7WX59_9EURO|nr:hypothetical protein AJ79_07937 [Helicocarpus griseus UAMH5409]
MQRAPGVPLNSIWPSLTKSEKDNIVIKLRHAFDAMRQAECPWPDFFGSLDGCGGLRHYLFWCQKGGRRHLGPFYGEVAFVEALTSNYQALIKRRDCPDFKSRAYETYLARVLKGHRPTLTHGDLQMKNIVIAESRRDDQGERLYDIELVDWEAAGWYPDFWEIFCATSTPLFLSWGDDWRWRIHEILDLWVAEMATMYLIDKDWL